MFFTYIIKSVQTKRYYIGYSADLVKRLSQHNTGQNISTKKGIPWILIHSEEFETSADAWKRERQIKSYKGGKAFKLLIGEVAFSPRLIRLGRKWPKNTMFYVYVLYSGRLKKRYVGRTEDLRNRILEHNRGESSFTSGGKPWLLIYYEAFNSKIDASEEEIFLKSGKGRERLDFCLKESMKEIRLGEVA